MNHIWTQFDKPNYQQTQYSDLILEENKIFKLKIELPCVVDIDFQQNGYNMETNRWLTQCQAVFNLCIFVLERLVSASRNDVPILLNFPSIDGEPMTISDICYFAHIEIVCMSSNFVLRNLLTFKLEPKLLTLTWNLKIK